MKNFRRLPMFLNQSDLDLDSNACETKRVPQECKLYPGDTRPCSWKTRHGLSISSTLRLERQSIYLLRQNNNNGRTKTLNRLHRVFFGLANPHRLNQFFGLFFRALVAVSHMGPHVSETVFTGCTVDTAHSGANTSFLGQRTIDNSSMESIVVNVVLSFSGERANRITFTALVLANTVLLD